MMDFGTGYRFDREDHAQLAATSIPLNLPPGLFAAPKTICHRAWRKVKNQRRMGSCTGASRASGGEVLNFIGSRGGLIDLSIMYCYLQNQAACGLLGADQGATIDGSVRAAMQTGFALEETFPYPDEYQTSIPPAATAEGRLHLIRSHSVLKTYDDVFNWIASGVGVVLIGVPWLSGMRRVGAKMDRDDLRGSNLGGHAMLLHGYGGPGAEPVVDGDGRPYIDDENSHDVTWGDGGFTLVAPRVIDYWTSSGATLIGISDMTTYSPREVVTYQEWMG